MKRATIRTTAERYHWSLNRVREHGIRLTHQRDVVLHAMAGRRLPVPLDVLGKELAEECDLATIYRTVHLLQKAGVVRQVNLTARCACFVLQLPNEYCHYLVCNHCGSINELPEGEVIWEIGRKVASNCGYKLLQCEAEFFGICPGCQKEEDGAGDVSLRAV